tara:strand:- start:463 stop:984 length:522 start_codon:yes stop_codon:yes gene_type:complete
MSEIEKAAKELVEEFRVDRENPENKGEIIKKRDMLPDNPHDVMHMLHQVEAIKRACNEAIKDIKDELLERYSGKIVRVGNKILIGKHGRKWKPVDSDKVLDYLGSDYRQAVRPNFRKGGIEAVAKKRGDNPRTIWDSLFYEELTETLSILDVENPSTPKYMKELGDLDEREIR